MAQGLPKKVKQFVERHLTTAAQAEVLVLVCREQLRSWTPAEVALRLRITPEHAEALLGPLASTGLMRREDEAFRYAPRTRQLAGVAEEFVAMYPRYRVAVNTVIFSRPSRSLEDFSDAFRLRGGEPPDG